MICSLTPGSIKIFVSFFTALVGCHDYCRALSVNYGVVKYIPKKAVRIGNHIVTDTCKAVIKCTDAFKLKKNLTLFCNKKNLKDLQWAEKSGNTLFEPPTCLPNVRIE